MQREIKHWSGHVLWSGEAATVKDALHQALAANANVLRGADLTDADLTDADLRDADLTGAVLTGAVLTDAVLTDAVLTDAVLRGAVLRGAVLRGAVLRGADLRGADLRGAVLTGAVLRGAVLRGAVLRGAVLRGAVLRGADLTGAVLTGADLTGVPVIPHIDAAILEAINGHPERLDMSSWHTCETTHCRAGWAVNLAGKPGLELEQRIGPSAAGTLIYAASRPKQTIPNFYASTKEAMKDLQACAKRDPLPNAKKAIRRKAQQ